MMKIRSIVAALGVILLSAVCSELQAQEVEHINQYRLGVGMDWKLAKGLKMTLEPELRLDEQVTLERAQVEVGLKYKTFGFLTWSASLRGFVEPSDDARPETYGQYFLSVMAKENFDRYGVSLRVLHSNYTNADVDNEACMRYRLKIDYDIAKSPFEPYFSAEIFQDLSKEYVSKMRYCTGVEYKIAKGKAIDFNYRLDYFLHKYRDKHIFSVGYNVSF